MDKAMWKLLLIVFVGAMLAMVFTQWANQSIQKHRLAEAVKNNTGAPVTVAVQTTTTTPITTP